MIHNESINDFDKKRESMSLVPERAHWSRPIEFVLTCLNYAVGLGNVWRYPSLVHRNKAGGAFMIPYLLMVFVIGLPIFFAELVVGQYSGQGPIKAYSYIAPLFKGIGYCTLIVITFVTIYYQVIISWIIFYLYSSFSSKLTWGTCDNAWNSESCFSSLEEVKCRVGNNNTATDQIYYKLKCTDVQSICSDVSAQLNGLNSTACINVTSQETILLSSLIKRIVSSEEFYHENLLGVGDATWHNFGWPQGHLVLCLAIAWFLCFLCVIKGVQSMGKLVYFTSMFPYIVLSILLIRGLTLDGAWDGVIYYITPKWESLLKPSIWGDSSSQIFYSFGIGCGSLVTLASYNKFKNNCHFDALFVSLTNFFTAVFSGFVVFAILGFLAKIKSVEIDDVINSGPGLAFVTYPEAVVHMPWPQFWAVLFFCMMFVLGIGSQFGGIEAINTSIIDHWPHLRKHQWRVTAGTSICCFIAGLPMTCNGGVYYFTLLDWHTASWAILLIGFAEVIVLSWVYGVDRIFLNIQQMGIRLNWVGKLYWKAVWIVISPAACIGVFAYTIAGTKHSEYRDYVFPMWADLLGWFIGFATLIPLICSCLKPFICCGSMELSDYLNPTLKWGPNEKETSVTKSLLNLNFDVNKHLSILEEDLKHEADLDFD